MKKLCALLRIIFFSQQDDTKNTNCDEGVLILFVYLKSHNYVPKIFHCLASPGKVSTLAL